MTTFLQTLETFFWNVLNRPGLSDIADILIVAIIIYELLMLTRDTRGADGVGRVLRRGKGH